MPTNLTSSSLHLDIDDLSDHQRTEDLHDDGHGQHLRAHRVGKQHHDVTRIELIDGEKQHEGQCQQHDAREASFAGQRLDLSPDAEAIADQAADLVEDFGQIAAGLPLQNDGRDEKFQVEIRNPFGQFLEAFFHGDAEILFLENAAEFACRSAGPFRWPPC